MSKLEDTDRNAISKEAETADGPAWNASSKPMQKLILRVLLSIDERLAETNDFYLRNQEERTRPNG